MSPNSAPTPYAARFLLRVGIVTIIFICLLEIVVVCSLYLHEPLAWLFLLQAGAMLIGAIIGLIAGLRHRLT